MEDEGAERASEAGDDLGHGLEIREGEVGTAGDALFGAGVEVVEHAGSLDVHGLLQAHEDHGLADDGGHALEGEGGEKDENAEDEEDEGDEE